MVGMLCAQGIQGRNSSILSLTASLTATPSPHNGARINKRSLSKLSDIAINIGTAVFVSTQAPPLRKYFQ
ncbi:hypothetical protein D3C78_1382770 [compost metagenome]